MTCEYVKPSSFVTKGEKVEVLFMNEDDNPSWYKGIVMEIHHSGEDDYGTYVECEVEYEDGEVIKDSRFYDCDFNNSDSLDTWKFSNMVTMLIESLDETRREIDRVKNGESSDDESSDVVDDIPEKPRQTVSSILFGVSMFLVTGFFIKQLYCNYTKYVNDVEECRIQSDINEFWYMFNKACYNVINKYTNQTIM